MEKETKRAKILIIEDDLFLSSIYVTKIEKSGYETLVCEDGEKGWELVQKEKPDLVLLDILLPKISGFDILKKMKATPELKDIPVILLTNLRRESEVEEGLKLGAVDYLIKAHFTPVEVIRKIEKVLKSR